MNPPRQVQQPPLMSDGRLHSVSELSCILPFLLAEHTTYKHARGSEPMYVWRGLRPTRMVMGGRYHTLTTMAQLVIIRST